MPATIEICQNLQEDTGAILADATQIHQVLMNLCTNAANAMQTMGGTLKVSLSEVALGTQAKAHYPDLKPGKYLKLSVSDTGCGMDRITSEQIFDPYFTTKPREDGTGLGLSVVHGIVKSFGGSIRVESEPERGTTFHVIFPGY